MTDGGPRRSGAAAAVLPRCRMPGSLLPLLPLRSRTALLQCRLPGASQAPATALRQPPLPAEPRRAARSPGPPAAISPAPGAEGTPSFRDGSRFPFDHVSGIILLWDGFRSTGKGPRRILRRVAAAPARNPAWHKAVLLDLRPHRQVYRSVPAHSTTKVRPS